MAGLRYGLKLVEARSKMDDFLEKHKFEQKRRYFAQIDLHFVHPVIFPLFLFQHIFVKIFQYYLIQIFIFQCRTFV